MSQGYRDDSDYYASYADPGVHRLMISDTARTDAYRRALEAVSNGKRVLDVGTGTGILSMFAARAGASSVVAVDRSKIVEMAEQLAEDNGFADKIEFRRGTAEELTLDSQVDVLVSEWMGFFGLAELMFKSVIAARDRWLAPDGIMVPGRLRLRFAPLDDTRVLADLGVGLWERPVYGLDFSRLVEHEVTNFITAACDIDESSMAGQPETVLDLDLRTAEVDDFFYTSTIELVIERDARIVGFGGWFEVDLTPDIELSCAPDRRRTHWRQSFFPIRPIQVQAGDKLKLAMQAHPSQLDDPRLPLYFMDGEHVRDGEALSRFFYRHHGSFE